MADYKLYHFNTRYLADPIRFIFLYSDVPFEDIRLSLDEWRDLKEGSAWEQLPILELVDGRKIGQSGAISEFLAKKFDLIGENEFDTVRCHELSDTMRDIRGEWRKVFFQKNRDRKFAAKHKFVNLLTTNHLVQLNEWQENSGGSFLICPCVTYADFIFAENITFIEETLGIDLLEDFPKLKKVRDNVLNLPRIKEYLEEGRSKSDITILNHIHTFA